MSESRRFFMALDVGTGAGRAVLVDVEGREIYSGYQEWTFDYPPDAQPGGVSFDPNRFWQVLGSASRQAMAKAGISADQVVGVSSTSLREGFVLLDKQGKEIWAVPNRDARAWAEAPVIGEQYGPAMYEASGHWPSAGMAPPRFAWLQRHQPHIIEQAVKLLMINDWVLYKLSGELACEPTNGAETCLLDIRTHTWRDDLIRACGVSPDLFPPVLSCGTLLGKVTQAAAEVTGLRVGTPVVVGGADTQCGVLGSGLQAAGQVCAVAGTTTPNQMVLQEAVIDSKRRTWSAPYCIPGYWVLESNAGATGIVQRWFRDSFCGLEVAEAARTNEDPYVLMEQLARQSPIGCTGITGMVGPRIMNVSAAPAPWLSGFIVRDNRQLIAEGDSRKHFMRAVLESHAYGIRGNCAQIEEVSGRTIDSIVVCGGCSASDFWMQMLADATGVPTVRPRFREASSVGTAICSGVGIGAYADFAQGIATLVRMDQRFEPQHENKAAYDAAYQQWYALVNTRLS